MSSIRASTSRWYLCPDGVATTAKQDQRLQVVDVFGVPGVGVHDTAVRSVAVLAHIRVQVVERGQQFRLEFADALAVAVRPLLGDALGGPLVVRGVGPRQAIEEPLTESAGHRIV
jgi:hypothetical protein